MTIVNINYASLKNSEKFTKYVSHAARLLLSQGVEVICRGKHSNTLGGEEQEEHIVAVFRFTSTEAVKNFYECDEYLKILPLRKEACDMKITFYEELG
jgi:uncharacterized protein (DUF1330 family)